MATVDLNKIKLGFSPLSDEIYLYRHGEDETVALDKRLAERDVLAVITEYMMHDAPKGSTKQFCFGDQWYELKLTPIETPK